LKSQVDGAGARQEARDEGPRGGDIGARSRGDEGLGRGPDGVVQLLINILINIRLRTIPMRMSPPLSFPVPDPIDERPNERSFERLSDDSIYCNIVKQTFNFLARARGEQDDGSLRLMNLQFLYDRFRVDGLGFHVYEDDVIGPVFRFLRCAFGHSDGRDIVPFADADLLECPADQLVIIDNENFHIKII